MGTTVTGLSTTTPGMGSMRMVCAPFTEKEKCTGARASGLFSSTAKLSMTGRPWHASAVAPTAETGGRAVGSRIVDLPEAAAVGGDRKPLGAWSDADVGDFDERQRPTADARPVLARVRRPVETDLRSDVERRAGRVVRIHLDDVRAHVGKPAARDVLRAQ